ncbi:FAD-dependent monooxygenase [Cohnella fermenti]|uniref:FAD-binding protein n=1 Tax=Cohnella fermenti TaxID=2565925 RepID=A0A4S4BGP1_9BACL|nr:FAD-dependent monooxygenase [Cohnella fermenti]THF72985.1 FAD-binding protein [Cohnella fermenti]
MLIRADVCIVGGGPGGALLGYLLAKRNVSVVLVERHVRIDKEFRGEHLTADGEDILVRHGLFDQVVREGLLPMKRVEYWQKGAAKEVLLPNQEAGEAHMSIHVPQRSLLGAIMQQAKRLPSFRLLMGTAAKGLRRDSAGRTNGIAALKNGEEIAIESSVVVGADGRHSLIRKWAGIPTVASKHGFDLLWAKIPQPNAWEPVIRNALSGDQPISLFTQAGGHIQIGWNIPEDSYSSLRKGPIESFLRRLIDEYPDLEAAVRQHIVSWDDFILLKVYSSYSETWARDGIVIMGDAAHTMSPTGAFGINCALKDADVLAELLLRLDLGEPVPAERLQEFERQRREEIDRFHRLQQEKEISYASHFTA